MKINITIPARNEATVLADNVRAVHALMVSEFTDDDWLIVVVDSASTDTTALEAMSLADELPRVRMVHSPFPGKGRAVIAGWNSDDADISVFMDADLSTGLKALRPLVQAVRDGIDVAVGSRFHARSNVSRPLFRRLISRAYRHLLRNRLGIKVMDAPCGFKAVSRRALDEIVPQVRSRRWFFDTELLARAERAGLEVIELPVSWQDRNLNGRKPKLNVIATSLEYLWEVERLRRELGIK